MIFTFILILLLIFYSKVKNYINYYYMKIVLVIPYRGIGDLIFHIPLIRGLSKKYNEILSKYSKSQTLLSSESSNDNSSIKVSIDVVMKEDLDSNDLLKEISSLDTSLSSPFNLHFFPSRKQAKLIVSPK